MPETRVIIDLSNRHIHLSAEDLVALFGPGYSLTRTKALLQPGQFAAAETVAIARSQGQAGGRTHPRPYPSRDAMRGSGK